MFTYAELTKRYEKLKEKNNLLSHSDWYYRKRTKELEKECEELKTQLMHFGMLLDVKMDEFNKRSDVK